VLQGAFIMAKARQDVEAGRDSLDHLYRYVELRFGRSTSTRKATKSNR
jgi:TetR/AcrR family transcriptional repressor of nem operon